MSDIIILSSVDEEELVQPTANIPQQQTVMESVTIEPKVPESAAPVQIDEKMAASVITEQVIAEQVEETKNPSTSVAMEEPVVASKKARRRSTIDATSSANEEGPKKRSRRPPARYSEDNYKKN